MARIDKKKANEGSERKWDLRPGRLISRCGEVVFAIYLHGLTKRVPSRPVYKTYPRKWRIPEKRHKIFDAFAVFTSVRNFKNITIKKV